LTNARGDFEASGRHGFVRSPGDAEDASEGLPGIAQELLISCEAVSTSLGGNASEGVKAFVEFRSRDTLALRLAVKILVDTYLGIHRSPEIM
jgi:hypothetical protein